MKKCMNDTLKILTIFVLFINVSAAASLPDDIKWLTNTTSPEWSSTEAKKGGLLRLHIASFPPTLRTVGPDSSNYFRSFLTDNQMPLVSFHPNSGEIIPMLASHWAYASDGKTVYYKIKKKAQWSNGLPVTADDFLFALKFNRSKYIVAPWYNKHFNEEIVDIIKYDSHTIAIVGARVKPKKDLHYFYAIKPRAKHFHRLDDHWVNHFNWKVEPNTGPYKISNIRKGKLIAFQRKLDWWGNNDQFLRNRFNVDNVLIKVVRDPNTAFKYFERGELDVFNLTMPKLWHEKANGPMFQKGFIHKLSFYNQTEQSPAGLFLNLDNKILQDVRVRKAIAHSLNLDKIIQQLLHNDYKRLSRFHSGYGKFSNKKIIPLAFDLKQANDYLEAAGWNNIDSLGIRSKGNDRLSLTVSYGNKLHEPQITVLAKEARKAGIELRPQYFESTPFYQHVIQKKHDIAWLGWSPSFRPAYWQYFHSDNAQKSQTNNITNLANPEIDSLIDQYRKSTKEKERVRLAHVIESKIAAQVVFIPSTLVPFTRVGFWRWLKLPESIATRSSTSLFNPFHPTQGGLFWIDAKNKIDSLSARRSGKGFATSTVINTDYKITAP
ncbi:MAG: microcin C transport system substrate-binding protein [Oleispira sp.]|jgi:microcin C transport system substrate-binding protein